MATYLFDIIVSDPSKKSPDLHENDVMQRVRQAINYICYLLSGYPSHVMLPKSSKLTSETIKEAVCQAEKTEDEPYLSEIYVKLAVILVKMKGGDHSHYDEADAIINKFYDGMKLKFL